MARVTETSRAGDWPGEIFVDRDDRDWVLPLAVGLVIAIASLAVGVTYFNQSVEHYGGFSDRGTKPFSGDTSKTPVSIPDRRVGRGELSTPTLAWISHSDWRELQARRSPTRQPALQQEVDPVEDAPVPDDPTPPSPEPPPQPDASASPPTPQATPSAPPAADAAPTTPSREPELPTSPAPPEAAGIAPGTDEGPLPEGTLTSKPALPETQPPRRPRRDALRVEPAPAPPTQADPQVNPQTDSQAEADPSTPRTAASRPTSAPRSEETTPPTDTEEQAVEVSPGRVLTGPGVKIITVRPELSVTARYMAFGVTRNPVAILTFDHDGKVTDVTLRNPTGLENIDAPLRASLYKWKAEGKDVEALREGQTFQKRFTILFFDPD